MDAAVKATSLRVRLSQWLLAPLVIGMLVAAIRTPFHSVMSVDDRSYLEMIRGISSYGLPILPNGPAERFPELHARFNAFREGRLWGAYSPVYPYMAIPAFRLGGVRGVIRFNIVLMLLVALGARAIASRLHRDPMVATACAYLVTCSTPMFIMASDPSPYTLMIALTTWSTHFAVRSVQETGAHRWRLALLSGFLAGLSSSSQPLVLPMALMMGFVLFVLPAHDVQTETASPATFDGWFPTWASVVRGLAYGAGFLAPLCATSFFNHVRSGTWNPIDAGMCPWLACETTGIRNQAPSAMLAYAMPVLMWALVSIGCFWLVRTSRTGRWIVVIVSLMALVPPTRLHHHTLGLCRLLWGFTVDLSDLDMGFRKPADQLGNMLGPFVVKSTLQSLPIAALAGLSFSRARNEQHGMLIVGAACVGLYLSLAMRAPVPAAYALGFPLLSLRYVTPALPLLIVLAVHAMGSLRWTMWHTLATVVIASVLTRLLWRGLDDGLYLRRLFLLRIAPACGLAGLLLALRARSETTRTRRTVWGHAACIAAVCAVASGISVNVGVDLRALIGIRKGNDSRVDAIAKQVPQRFALVGWPVEIDTPLTMRATHDIEYADMFESKGWDNLRRLIDYWTIQQRPIFAIWPTHEMKSPWPEVVFEEIDPAQSLFRIELRVPPNPQGLPSP